MLSLLGHDGGASALNIFNFFGRGESGGDYGAWAGVGGDARCQTSTEVLSAPSAALGLGACAASGTSVGTAVVWQQPHGQEGWAGTAAGRGGGATRRKSSFCSRSRATASSGEGTARRSNSRRTSFVLPFPAEYAQNNPKLTDPLTLLKYTAAEWKPTFHPLPEGFRVVTEPKHRPPSFTERSVKIRYDQLESFMKFYTNDDLSLKLPMHKNDFSQIPDSKGTVTEDVDALVYIDDEEAAKDAKIATDQSRATTDGEAKTGEDIRDPAFSARLVDTSLLLKALEKHGRELPRHARLLKVNHGRSKFGGVPLNAGIFDFNQYLPAGTTLHGISSKWWAENHPSQPIKYLDGDLNADMEEQLRGSNEQKGQLSLVMDRIKAKVKDAAAAAAGVEEAAAADTETQRQDQERFSALVPEFITRALESLNDRISDSGMTADGERKVEA